MRNDDAYDYQRYVHGRREREGFDALPQRRVGGASSEYRERDTEFEGQAGKRQDHRVNQVHDEPRVAVVKPAQCVDLELPVRRDDAQDRKIDESEYRHRYRAEPKERGKGRRQQRKRAAQGYFS
ncbi:MAG: hypothetical protein ACXWG6_14280, partial [Usitatibacter sp.]